MCELPRLCGALRSEQADLGGELALIGCQSVAGVTNARLLGGANRGQDEQGDDGHRQDEPSGGHDQAAWPPGARVREPPQTARRCHICRRRRGAGCGPLNDAVQRRRVLAPEVLGGRWEAVIAEWRSGAWGRGAADGHELLARPEPVAWQPHHVLLVPSVPASVFGLPMARFHGFADLSSPPEGVSVSLER